MEGRGQTGLRADSGRRAWGLTRARMGQLGWMGPWSPHPCPRQVWPALGNHQNHRAGSGGASGGGRGRPDGEERAGGGERKEGWEATGSGPKSLVCWNDGLGSLVSEKMLNSQQEPHGSSPRFAWL